MIIMGLVQIRSTLHLRHPLFLFKLCRARHFLFDIIDSVRDRTILIILGKCEHHLIALLTFTVSMSVLVPIFLYHLLLTVALSHHIWMHHSLQRRGLPLLLHYLIPPIFGQHIIPFLFSIVSLHIGHELPALSQLKLIVIKFI